MTWGPFDSWGLWSFMVFARNPIIDCHFFFLKKPIYNVIKIILVLYERIFNGALEGGLKNTT